MKKRRMLLLLLSPRGIHGYTGVGNKTRAWCIFYQKLEISSVYLLEVQSKMLETVSTKVMDCF